MPSPRHAPARFKSPDFAQLDDLRATYKSMNLMPRTVASYAADVRVFTAWCAAAKLDALPATENTLELYLTDLLQHGRKLTTLERHCFAIQGKHRAAGYSSPYGAGAKKLLIGARRRLAQLPDQKAALETRDLRAILRKIGSRTAICARNSALLVFGFATALRRASLACLRREDVQFTRDGFTVDVRHEKQDRKGNVRRVAVPFGKRLLTCPVKVLRRWLHWRGDDQGALFCRCLNGIPDRIGIKGNRIAQIVQESVTLIGLDRRHYAAHSLRAGFASEALSRGVNELAVVKQTGHASLNTLRIYDRTRNLFIGNAAGMVGL